MYQIWITSVSRTFDSANCLEYAVDGGGTTTYTYDANGNLIERLPPGATGANPVGGLRYDYNQRNLMVGQETNPDGTAWALQAAYVYDGANDRLQQIDYTGATPITTTYVNDIFGLTQVLVADDGTNEVYNLFGLDLISQDSGAEVRTLLVDGLGSVRQELVGSVVETATTYSPYGEVLAQAGTSGTVYGFTGEQEDGATGLLYLRARYYNALLGTFVSRDPWSGSLWSPSTLHGYGYASSNPTNRVDYTGLFSSEPGYIEYFVQRMAPAWNIFAGPNLWLEAALYVPTVQDVYEKVSLRLIGNEFYHGTVTQLYASTLAEATRAVQADPCVSAANGLREAAHISLITLGAFARGVGERGGDPLNGFPGYIPNPQANNPRERRGADTAQHFFFHAFLSYEMRYSSEYAGRTADDLAQGLLRGGVANKLVMDKINIIRNEYRSRGYQEYDYLSVADAYAYSFAVTAGDYYEVISTYDSFESQQPGGFCYEQGGLPWRLRDRHGCAIHAFTDSPESFQDMLNNPSSVYPSGIQDPGVFARDLRANRAGANFGFVYCS
jgi:RHS repeat-associated protein